MDDLKNIPLEELSKATNPFHVNVCEFDGSRITEAYPQMIIEDMLSSFNRQTDKYIVEKLISLNIDKDVLIKQTEEIQRLNSKVQELCDKAYEQGRADERAKAKSCVGCKQEHKWDIEVEFGCYSPCTLCSRRCADNYETD